MKILNLIPITILVVALSVPTLAFASNATTEDTNNSGRREKLEERKTERAENKEERKETMEQKREEIKENRTERRCDVVGNLVDKRIDTFEENKGNHVENYTKLKTRLMEVSSKLKAKGFDTTELDKDLVTFDSMVKEYASKYVSFIDTLKSSKDLVCGESEGAYKSTIESSKSMLKELKDMRKAIRDFYVSEIRADIKALRDQSVETSTTEEN